MKSFFYEFKKFISRGNVIDMAVGIIIGSAFTKVVNSLVADIIMPPLGILLGKIDFSSWFIVLKSGVKTEVPYVSLEAAKTAGATTLNIGFFIKRSNFILSISSMEKISKLISSFFLLNKSMFIFFFSSFCENLFLKSDDDDSRDNIKF